MNAPLWIDVAPLLAGHEAEIEADLRRLARETCVDSAAFCCPLHPEGEPPVDKAAAYAPLVAAMKRRLEGSGLRVGVLVQSSMGHGYEPDTPSHFQRLELRDGRKPYVCCPLDGAFRAHVRAQVAALVAATKPDFLLVDDDTRLGSGYGGCLCPLHRAALAERTGAPEMSFEALAAALASGADPALQRAFDETQAASMELFFRDLRAAIDTVDPALPVTLCSCGYEMPLAPRFSGILAPRSASTTAATSARASATSRSGSTAPRGSSRRPGRTRTCSASPTPARTTATRRPRRSCTTTSA